MTGEISKLPLPLGFFAAIYHARVPADSACKTGVERYFAAKSASPELVTLDSENGARLELFIGSACRLRQTGTDGEHAWFFPATDPAAGSGVPAAGQEPGEAVPGRYYTLYFSRNTGEF